MAEEPPGEIWFSVYGFRTADVVTSYRKGNEACFVYLSKVYNTVK